MWFVIIYHSMLPIRNAQRFISSLISDMHRGSVHGAGKMQHKCHTTRGQWGAGHSQLQLLPASS